MTARVGKARAWMTSIPVRTTSAVLVMTTTLATVRASRLPSSRFETKEMSQLPRSASQYHWTALRSKIELQVTELAIATNWLIASTPEVGISKAIDSVFREAMTLLFLEPCMRLETIRLATATNTPVKIAQRTLAIVAMIKGDSIG